MTKRICTECDNLTEKQCQKCKDYTCISCIKDDEMCYVCSYIKAVYTPDNIPLIWTIR